LKIYRAINYTARLMNWSRSKANFCVANASDGNQLDQSTLCVQDVLPKS